ncbi:hypothetical protein GCM10009805_20240 [Leucobacter chromiireducens subsp. solipictus]
MPDLVGNTYASAEASLDALDLGMIPNPNQLVQEVSGEFIEITAQEQEPGTRVYAGDSVSVSVAPVEISVPDLGDMTIEHAETELAAVGLFLERVNSIPENLDDYAEGVVSMWKVTEQSITPGKKVDAGTGVVISVDIPDVEVPALEAEADSSSDLDAAQASFEASAADEISRALLVPVFVGTGNAPLSMSPATGQAVPAFTEVKVTLGITMPDLVGKDISVSSALAMLKSLGFSNVTRAHDDDTVVVSQSVAAGTIVAADSEVRLENRPKGYMYRVTGNGSVADITWSQPGSFNVQQANSTSLPWEKAFDPAMSGIGMLSAFMSDGGTEITCQVVKDGKVVKENTSTGPYAMVSCY